MSVARAAERTKYLYRKEPYLYFRMADGKLVPLPTDTKSAEFNRAYDACLRTRKGIDKETAKQEKPERTVKVAPSHGTVRAAVAVYKETTHYRDELRPSTRAAYEDVIQQLTDSIGDALMADFVDVDVIDEYIEEVSKKRTIQKVVCGHMRKITVGGRAVARMHLLVLRELWKSCRRQPEFNIKKVANPFRDAQRPYRKAAKPAMPWSPDDQNKFLATAPDHLSLGVLMLKYFGQRGSDVVRVLWQDFVSRVEIVDRKKVTKWGIMVAPQKGDDAEPEFLELPDVLVGALLAARKERSEGTIVVNAWGKPYASARGLSQAIRLHLMKIGLRKKGIKSLVMHGLRKNAAIMAADTDFGVDGIKTITLHRSNDMAAYYAERRNKEQLRSKVIARINEMEADAAKPGKRLRVVK